MNTIEVLNQYPNEFNEAVRFYSIGIHPWYIDLNRLDKDLEIINQKLENNNALAVGECGLDKRISTPVELQKKVFEQQILLAEKHQKPLIIHCVSAFQELIAIKKELSITVPIIIHGFSKNEILANQLIREGFYLSFGKYLIKNPELKNVFKKLPLNQVFLETDTIEETIEDVYTLAASYKEIEVERVKIQLLKNFKLVFPNYNEDLDN